MILPLYFKSLMVFFTSGYSFTDEIEIDDLLKYEFLIISTLDNFLGSIILMISSKGSPRCFYIHQN